jgi:serine/threonine protein kinase
MEHINSMIQKNAIDYFPEILFSNENNKKIYWVEKYLDQGTYGTIFLLENLEKEKVVAKITNTNKHKICVKNEIDCMNLCKHKTIIKYHNFYYNPDNEKSMIIMEYANAGNLKQVINNRRNYNMRMKNKTSEKYFPEEQIINTIYQLLLALNCVHRNNIIHRDIKPENIYLTSDDILKLGDFHLAIKCDDNIKKHYHQCVGTPYYVAPEIWKKEKYNYKVDVWSLGILIYELMALHLPFFSHEINELENLILNGKYEYLPECYSDELVNLVDSMINVDPDHRPDIIDIMEMNIIKKSINNNI